MPVYDTSFHITAAPLPSTFNGTPQEFFTAMVERMAVKSLFPITTFSTGNVKPTSNQGPWLKGGTQWWVWDDDAADYVPLDITESQAQVYVVQENEPTEFDPPIWFQVESGEFKNVYIAIASQWVPMFVTSGTTAERPTDPYNLQRFFDTDIGCEIWWERGQWRTTSGVPGDIKFVSTSTADDALEKNPGWEILGTGSTSNSSWIGRTLGMATKDAGSNPATELTVAGAVTAHARGDTVGAETHTLSIEEMPAHKHNVTGNGFQSGASASNKRVLVDDEHNSSNNTDTNGTASVGSGEAHNNIQPTLFLWCLHKL